jgi:hypothetical protein
LKTLIIGYNHSYNDKRVLRTVNALKKKGKVFYQYSGKRPYRSEGVECYPIKKKQLPGNRFTKRLRFDTKILEMVDKLDYDIAYFHYFPASKPLKIFKHVKKRNKKLIFELHEIIPEQFLSDKFSYLKPLLWNIIKKEFKLCDGLVAVSNEVFIYMTNKTKITKPFFILPNYANFSINPISKNKRKKRIIIVGGSQRKVDIDNGLVSRLKNEGFIITSIGIRSDIADEVLPFMEYNYMMKEISESAFSLMSFKSRKNPNYVNDIYSLANKFFDSLAAGTPVILNNRFVSMKKYIEKTKAGIIVNFNNEPDVILNKIRKMWNNYSELLSSLEKHNHVFTWNKAKEDKFVRFIEQVHFQ